MVVLLQNPSCGAAVHCLLGPLWSFTHLVVGCNRQACNDLSLCVSVLHRPQKQQCVGVLGCSSVSGRVGRRFQRVRDTAP